MGSILTNGVFLPAEGERNCYEGLAANWTALDGMIGGYNVHISNTTIHVTAEDKAKWDTVTGKADASALTAHTGDTTIHVTAEDKQMWDTVTGKADASALTAHTGNTTIHVTAEDKQAWNNHVADTVKHVTAEDKAKWDAVTGKADASALTAHTGDTTIHVTAADKEAWNNHVADTVKHVTAEDKAKWDAVTSKADDSDVVHKSGDESVIGSKRFGVVQRFTGYPSIRLYSTSDEWDVQPTFTQQSEIRYTDKNSVVVSYFVFQHRTDSTEPFRTCWRQVKMDGTGDYYSINFNNLGNFYPEKNNAITLGRSGNRWSDVVTAKVNSLEPSSLSLPSGNLNDFIDISSYLTHLDGTNNTYVAPANGWISITMSNCSGIQAYINGLWGHQIVRPSSGAVRFLMPVLKNQTVNILISGGTIDSARFIPCRGNI